jgi:fructokinase
MRNIYTIGETVLDIVFKNGQPVASTAGGSMLNTAVSLGRLGLPVHFISEYATDQVGEMIDGFLHSNGIDTQYVYHYSDGKSALALAFLDEKNNANYTFYKSYPQKRFAITFPEINEDDIVVFGSIYAIASEIRETLLKFLLYAKSRNALIIYDPNFRKPHLSELEILKPTILENMSLATIVRASNEDLELIFGAKDIESAYVAVKSLCPNLIYTSSSNAVFVRTPEVSAQFPVKKIEPVSTIGAGDTFNAGIAYGIFQYNIFHHELASFPLETWEKLVSYGVDFASKVCMSYENYISAEFAKRVAKS